MANKKDSVIFYQSQTEICKRHLTAEQFGRLMYALFAFSEGEYPEVEEDIALAFEFMSLQQRIDREKYEKKCETNRKNGRLGGRPKKNPPKANGFFKNPNENENDNDNDNDNENVNVNEDGFDEDDGGLYGVKHNVELAPGEYEHLRATYVDYKGLIDKVSVWLPNSKKEHVGDHFSLCLTFADKDNWAKKKKEKPVEPIVITDPLDPDEQEAKVEEMKARLNSAVKSS